MKKLLLLIVITMSLLISAPVHALDFFNIRDNMNSMTNLQWDSYTDSLKGRSISGTGWISNVDTPWFGDGYDVNIDMDNPDSLSIQDIYIDGVPQSIAYSLYKGQKVSFSGIITSVRNILGSCAVSIDYNTIR